MYKIMAQKAKQLIAKAKSEGLKCLDLGRHGLTDLEKQVPELFDLTDLEELILDGIWFDPDKRIWVSCDSKEEPNLLTKLPPAMSNLQNLKVLRCGGYFDNDILIKDISGLKELKQLTHLDLSINNINDISALKGLTNLTYLNLFKNKIVDISPLHSLTNLTELNLCNNKIVDISPLHSLTNLTELDLRNNKISDISTLKNLTGLTSLYLYDNEITDSEKQLNHLRNSLPKCKVFG